MPESKTRVGWNVRLQGWRKVLKIIFLALVWLMHCTNVADVLLGCEFSLTLA